MARQDGIHLPTAETRQQEGYRQVILAMRPAAEVLAADTTVQDALEKVRSSESCAWPVSDDRGLLGVISFGKLQQAAMAGSETKFNRANIHKLEGIVTLKDVFALYGVGSSEKA